MFFYRYLYIFRTNLRIGTIIRNAIKIRAIYYLICKHRKTNPCFEQTDFNSYLRAKKIEYALNKIYRFSPLHQMWDGTLYSYTSTHSTKFDFPVYVLLAQFLNKQKKKRKFKNHSETAKIYSQLVQNTPNSIPTYYAGEYCWGYLYSHQAICRSFEQTFSKALVQ